MRLVVIVFLVRGSVVQAKHFLAFIVVFLGGLGAGFVFFGAGDEGGSVRSSAPASEAAGAALDEAGVRRIVEAYIVENPVVIMRSVEDYQRNGFLRDIEARAEPFIDHLESLEGAARLGAAAPEVTIVEFFDYQCPHCKANYPVLERLLAEDPTIALLPKHLPILGDGSENDMSLYAARAAEAARLQGKFAPFHAGLMARETPLTRESVLAVAQDIGLDTAAFLAAIESPEVAAVVAQSRDIAADIGVMNAGTPGYIVGGKVMIGAAPDAYERLKAMIEEARQAGR